MAIFMRSGLGGMTTLIETFVRVMTCLSYGRQENSAKSRGQNMKCANTYKGKLGWQSEFSLLLFGGTNATVEFGKDDCVVPMELSTVGLR